MFAGAEFLMAVVLNAVPEFDLLYSKRRSAAEVAAHILTSLYDQLNDICLLEDGEVSCSSAISRLRCLDANVIAQSVAAVFSFSLCLFAGLSYY